MSALSPNALNDAATMAPHRPRVLFLSPIEPKADGNGVEKRGWSHLEALAEVADVHLVIAMLPMQDYKLIQYDRLRPLCDKLDVVLLERRIPLEQTLSLVSEFKRHIAEFFTPTFRLGAESVETIRNSCGDTEYDILFCFRLRSFRVWKLIRKSTKVRARKIYVDFDDIESLATSREIPFLKPIVGRVKTFFAWFEFLELWLAEHKAQKQVDGISICSSADRDRLKRRGGKAVIHVVPNSYPPTTQLPARTPGPQAEILFLGTMAYPPNEDAIIYFHSEILPLIRKQYAGDIRVNVVGLRPTARVLALGSDPAVNVTGGVASVIPYYEQADIVIAPIRFGGGTRIKILEALSYGRPMVASTIGAEGLGLESGRDILLADTPQDFADACVKLLKDGDLRARLVENGRQRIVEHFSLRRIQADFRQAILGVRG